MSVISSRHPRQRKSLPLVPGRIAELSRNRTSSGLEVVFFTTCLQTCPIVPIAPHQPGAFWNEPRRISTSRRGFSFFIGGHAEKPTGVLICTGNPGTGPFPSRRMGSGPLGIGPIWYLAR